MSTNKQHGKKVEVVVKEKKNKRDKKKTVVVEQKLSGKGGYSISDIAAKVAAPFMDSTESQGTVNKMARMAGSALGDATGLPGVGKVLGNAASWFSRLLGFGDYAIRSNSFLQTQNGRPASFQKSRQGSDLIITHEEFITDVTSTTLFHKNSYLLNPGNAELFPFLSKIAVNYEEYEFLGLVFTYKSTSATAVGSTNTGLGTVVMATDYDAYDDNFVDKRTMEAAEYSNSAAPCTDLLHPVECDSRRNVLRRLYVSPSTHVSQLEGDARMYTPGITSIATVGMQSASTVGELWVSYNVRLSRPMLESSAPAVSGVTLFNTVLALVANVVPTEIDSNEITAGGGARITMSTAAHDSNYAYGRTPSHSLVAM